jgi:hypothetical protein
MRFRFELHQVVRVVRLSLVSQAQDEPSTDLRHVQTEQLIAQNLVAV